MTYETKKEITEKTVLLQGVIDRLVIKQTTAEFFFSESDQMKMGATGTLAAAMGLSGVAAGMASMSTDETREVVTQMNFELNGDSVEALVWMCPFEEGQNVCVVAEKFGDYYKAFAVADPDRKTIAMYPHVSSGRIAHYKTTASAMVKFLFGFSVFGFFLGALFWWLSGGSSDWSGYIYVYSGGMSLTILIFVVIGVRISARYMPFVRIAEGVFRTMGWQNVERINLRRQTLENKKPGDDPYLGAYYFRY